MSHVFRKNKGKRGPIDVFDIVSNVIAQHLASEPITLPSFTQVAGDAYLSLKKTKNNITTLASTSYCDQTTEQI